MNDPLTNIAKLWIINVWQSSKCASVPQLIRSYHSFVLKFGSLILTKRRMRGLCSFCRKKKFKTVLMTSFTLLLWSSKHVWMKWRMCSSFDVVFWLIWRRDVVQPKINVETTLSISMLEFTASNNVKSTLRISTLMCATVDYVETTLSFSSSSFTTLVNVETTLWKWPFQKEQKQKTISSWMNWIQSF